MATEASRAAVAAASLGATGGPQLLRFATAGSVDDGKSTLIGRLLYDAKALMRDHAEAVADVTARRGGEGLDLSLITDGLRAEREQGITIDVAYRHFATPRRRFIIADCPGHVQYTRNMATGASTADLALVLVSAAEGIAPQARRHAAIAALLGIPRLVVCVNKMDLVGYEQDVFRRVCAEFRSWSARLDVAEVACVPVSALHGDNVVARSPHMPWYGGPTLLGLLEHAPVLPGLADGPLRLPVQWVTRDGDARSYAGRLASGTARAGEEVVVLPSGRATRVAAVETPRGEVAAAPAPLSVAVRLEDDLDVARGDLICRADEAPAGTRELAATLVWLGDAPAMPGARYLVKHTTRSLKGRLERIESSLDTETLSPRTDIDHLGLNEIGAVRVRLAGELHPDPYRANRATGSFILIDDASNETVAAGLVSGP